MYANYIVKVGHHYFKPYLVVFDIVYEEKAKNYVYCLIEGKKKEREGAIDRSLYISVYFFFL